MIDKYKRIIIDEIENGFILTQVFPDNPKWINKPVNIVKFFPNIDELSEDIKERL